MSLEENQGGEPSFQSVDAERAYDNEDVIWQKMWEALCRREYGEALQEIGRMRKYFTKMSQGKPIVAATICEKIGKKFGTLAKTTLPLEFRKSVKQEQREEFDQLEKDATEFAEELRQKKHEAIVTIGGPMTRKAWDLVREKHPEIAEIDITYADASQKAILKGTGGYFIEPSEFSPQHVEVVVFPGDPQQQAEVREARHISVEVICEKLGISPKAMTGEFLSAFIFLHELGHGVDYSKNYLEKQTVDPGLAAKQWRDRRIQEIGELPVPGKNPAEIAIMRANGSWSDFLRERGNPVSDEVWHELVEEQERAYRALPSESFADDFAVKILRDHLEEFGIAV